MNTLPFMHQAQTAGSGGPTVSSSGSRPASNGYVDKDIGRSSFEPAMRDAASRTSAKNSSARNNSSSKAQNNSDLARQEHELDEDLAGATMASQNKDNGGRMAPSRLDGAHGDHVSSTKLTKDSSELTDATGRSAKSTNSPQESGLALTGAENEKLQKQLKEVIQILEQNPAGSEIAAKLQDILRSIKDSASISEALPHLNLNESQAQNLAQMLQGNREGASISEALPHLNLKESQAQTLQDILATLKNVNEIASPDNSIDETKRLNVKLSGLLAQVEQALRRAQQGAQVQTVSQLKQPEIVDGFVLRAKKDKDGFNTASKVDDPRFAALLNKNTDFTSLRERQSQQNAQHPDLPSARLTGMNPQEQAQSLIQQVRAEVATASAGANGEAGSTGKGVLEGQAQLGSGNTGTPGSATADLMGMKDMAEAATAKDNAGVDFSAAQKGTGMGNNTDPGNLTLKNGTTIPNARVVDQTIQHLNLHARGDSSMVTVKLHPEELGELNIRMVMEGDQLKLQIQAQNQQVREILEQNFPRLRTAMEDQGVKVEDFQVSLGDSRAEDQAGTQSDDELARRRNADGTAQIAETDADDMTSADTPRRTATAGGLSVHV